MEGSQTLLLLCKLQQQNCNLCSQKTKRSNIENRIAEISATVRERLSIATFEGMRDLLELLQVKVVFCGLGDAIKLHVSCEIPGSEMDIVLMSS